MQKTTPWQTALINAVTDPQQLIELLDLDPKWIAPAKEAAALFPLKVPRGFIARMKKGDPNDPLLRQVLPLEAEQRNVIGYSTDPLQENKANPVPGLLHKYHGRVLLTLTSTCGINCRYCFRRHFAYEKNNPGTAGWENALDYITKDSSITEVILSGGDPLVVSDHLLERFILQLNKIPHLKRLRIHSRMPIVLPERITPELIKTLAQSSLKIILVTHCNHPQEIDFSVKNAINTLKQAGITLLNQAVLLKTINNEIDVLVNLSEKLFETGIQPYYLHVLDKVAGAAHFDLDLMIAKQLHAGLTHRLSGYLVPKLVTEQPGQPAKTLLTSF